MKRQNRLILSACAVGALYAPLAAYATTVPLPEPGTWSLLAMGLAACAIVSIRKRRK